MATDSPASVTVSQEAIDQRLDAVDRVLLGLLPRSERMAFVARLETTIRQRLTENPASEIGLAEPVAEASLPSARPRSALPKCSVAAFTAGLSGIASIVLLFIVLPLAYIAVALLSSTLDFDATILAILLGLVPLAACVAGCAAMVLGIVGLVKIARREGALVGRGWAVTGLCTGPMPVLCVAVPLLIIGAQLLAAGSLSVEVNPVAYNPSPCTSCSPASPYSPATVPAPGYPVAPYAVAPVCPPPPTRTLPSAGSMPASPYPDSVSANLVPVVNPLPPELSTSPPLPLAAAPSSLPAASEASPEADKENESSTPPQDGAVETQAVSTADQSTTED